jgi:hypothetical protein
LQLLVIEEIDDSLPQMSEAFIRIIKGINVAQIKIIILYSNITPHGRLFAEALISGANSQEGKGFT